MTHSTSHPADMIRYHAWATQTILKRIQELPASVLHQEVNSSFPTIAHALSHIHAVDRMWHLVLTGTSMPEAFQATMALNTANLDSVEEYADLFAKLAEDYTIWLNSCDDVEQTLLLDNPFAGIRETSVSEMLLHVANHGSYHRGNISTMLRQLGHASTYNDYAFYWYQ